MKSFTLILCATAFFTSSFSQDREELWLGAGIKREIFKDVVAGFQTNARVNSDAVWQTFFQEVSLKSEHLKWLRPSVDYRFITVHEENGNTTFSNRLNFNADFRHKINELKIGTRFRYQIFLGDFIATGTDLDPSFRIKPYISMPIPKTRFTPELTAEIFYNPQNGPTGDRFNRVRLGASVTIDLPNSNEMQVTYYYGIRYNTGNPYREHIVSLEYSYEWKTASQKAKKESKKKKEKAKQTSRSIRYL